MPNRWIMISLLITVAGVSLFFLLRTPPGLEVRSATEERIALFGMIAGVAGAISAALGVVKELISIRNERRKKS